MTFNLRVIYRKWPVLTYPPAFNASVGVTPIEFRRGFGTKKLESLSYCVALFAWSYV